MKTTYLINSVQLDGSTALAETTAEHWREIVRKNKQLPKEERRYFIDDIIREPGVFDCVIVEVPYKDYLHYDSMRTLLGRNRILKKTYHHFSIDDGFSAEIPCDYDLEETVLADKMICELRDALKEWQPWGIDFLRLYLNGQKGSSVSIVARKYGVSLRQARRYKDQFNAFVKNFYCY